ncbi:Flagellar biosynthesis protein FliQ [human gut metagenome]|uniref:Flagellar biosynthetic protein FliQ n=1 Tax=human gut metagenome TaxID=408170 RepID=K1RV28_9ZZZZ
MRFCYDDRCSIGNDDNALYVIIKVSLPVLLVSLVVGLVISIFQTVTSIQEQTLTFVPKIVAIFLCLVVIGHWMMNTMVEYTVQLWSSFSQYVHR